jgi:hypothetical protein
VSIGEFMIPGYSDMSIMPTKRSTPLTRASSIAAAQTSNTRAPRPGPLWAR